MTCSANGGGHTLDGHRLTDVADHVADLNNVHWSLWSAYKVYREADGGKFVEAEEIRNGDHVFILMLTTDDRPEASLSSKDDDNDTDASLSSKDDDDDEKASLDDDDDEDEDEDEDEDDDDDDDEDEDEKASLSSEDDAPPLVDNPSSNDNDENAAMMDVDTAEVEEPPVAAGAPNHRNRVSFLIRNGFSKIPNPKEERAKLQHETFDRCAFVTFGVDMGAHPATMQTCANFLQKAMSGKGVPHKHWGKNKLFDKKRISMQSDFMSLIVEAKQFEANHGKDGTRGYTGVYSLVMAHYFQSHLLNELREKDA